MTELPTARVGRTDLRVTRLAFGCVPLGNYPTKLTEAEAAGALEAAWEAGIRYYDVAPLYGHGLAEHRLGAALRQRPRGEFTISTKVGRRLVPQPDMALSADPSAGIFEDPLPFSLTNDYTYDGIMRSVEDSLQRLGLASVDILHIHNIDPANHAPEALEALFRTCMSDGYRALEQLRAEGTVKALGVGNNSLTMCQRFAEEGDFDAFMMAGHFHLLDQPAAESFLPECARRGISILLGSVFASGLLVENAAPDARYMYGRAPAEVLERLARLRGICADHGISLTAAALRFPLTHPAVACVVPGMRTSAEVRDCAEAFAAPLPANLFKDMQDAGLIDARVPLG
ncbi:aldo/keto reductase [Halovulum sp. GXIMD14794]